MYGGAGKHGRGCSGGRGGVGVHGKRNIHSTFTAHPLHRPSPVSGGRLSLGGGSAGPRQRVSTASAPPSSAPSAVEETFNLVTGNPLNFAMTIQRLPPDLVEEIKRVEAQGGVARIKFDANANANASNTFGNVIVDVGGKNFRFTWSRDTGDLCDTYEQRQSGEDGNGLLVESGCAWRKLNLQRVLDESTTNHVKMLSEEADPKNRTRKSKLLDHGNPSMKSQMKAMAAVEANPRRQHFKQKKESPFKKRKVEPPPGGPPKSVHISGLSGTTPSKGRLSASPMPSPSEQLGALASPSGTGEPSKMQVYVEDAMPPQVMMGRENAVSGPEKEMSSRLISGAATDKHGRKGDLGTKPADLRSMLVSLLMENPKGMSLKALEKAIRDTIPNSARQIEQVLKKIANFQAPGRYILKPGVEFESSKKLSSESGSSPEDNRHETPALENNFHQLSSSENTFSVRDNVMELQEPAQLNSKPGEDSNVSDKVDLSHHSPNPPLGEKKVSDNSEGPVGSSSNSGSDSDSDSDSDSSDSGSDSGSHSKKSPVGSGSGSSSDSESDASSNSKEGSDEDVDIMTSDDEKESKHKSQPSELGFSTSDGGPVHSGIDEKHDGHSSDIVEIEKDSPDNGLEAEMAVVTNSGFNKEVNKPVEESNTSSIGHHEHQESRVYSGNLSSERENVVKDGFKLEQSNSSERTSQGKYKRGNEGNNFNDKPENSKRFKAGNMSQPQVTSRIPKDGTGFGVQKGYDQSLSGQSIYESPQLGRRPIDVNVRAKTPAMGERSDRNADSLGHDGISSERSLHAYGGFPVRKDKVNTVTHDEDGYSGRKKASSNSREGGLGDRNTAPVDFQYRNHKELTGKFKEAGPVSNSRNGFFPVDNNGANMNRSPAVNGQRSILQRELSDLELGELREPLNEETPSVKKQLEKKTSFKQLETNPTTLDHWNSNSSKGKPPGRAAADLRMFSPNVGISSNPESLSKKKSPEHLAEDFARPHHRVMQPQPQHQSRVANNEFGSQTNKLPDLTSKNRHIESRLSQGIGLEINGDPQRRVPVGAQQQHDTEQVAPRSTEESKQHNAVDVFSDKRNGTSLMETDDGGQTRKESSWDEENLYSKYEKEEPELKGPIKDFSQYKEYVQEYCEKYDAYCSLNKILESYRNDFKMLGKDLDMAKGVDLKGYNIILERLKDTYRQCGKRHKRLKKIFVVLHEELKHLKQMIKDFAVSYTKD